MTQTFLLLLFSLVTCSSITWTTLSVVSDPASVLASNHFGTCALSSISQTCAFVSARGSGSTTGSVYFLNRTDGNAPFSGPPVEIPLESTSREGGACVALSARCEVAAVGAPSTSFANGRVYIYTPCLSTPSGWCLTATISFNGLGSLPALGNALAFSERGTTIVVGASNAASQAGAVIVCDSSNGLVNSSSWACSVLPIPSVQLDYLGYAVAVDAAGLTLAISATTPSPLEAGKVWVISRPSIGSSWGIPLVLPFACGLSGSNRNFGKSVAMSADGNTIIVGAPLGGYQRGAAVVFDRTTSTSSWSCTAKLQPSGATEGDAVGSAVGISSDGLTALVTSSLRFAFIFQRANRGINVSDWKQTGELPAPVINNINFGENFAASLSADGSTALIGSPGSLSVPASYRGNVTLFKSPASASATASATSSATASVTSSSSSSSTTSATASSTSSSSSSSTTSQGAQTSASSSSQISASPSSSASSGNATAGNAAAVSSLSLSSGATAGLSFGVLASIAGLVALAIHLNRKGRVIKKNPLSKSPDLRQHPAFSLMKTPNPLAAVPPPHVVSPHDVSSQESVENDSN